MQKRVLVVDDNVDAARALEHLLHAMGHQAFVAFDGATALRLLATAKPDVALLDITMPDMSGYDLARQIRAFLGAAVRIVALTGFGLPEDRQRALEAGFDQHVVKPVEPAFLKSLLG